MKTTTLLVGLAVAGLGTWVGLIYSGHYDIGADQPHWPITLKLMKFQRERSIAAHASGITAPALDDPGSIAEGAEHYAAMCSGCHLAPGMESTEIRAGLYPQPPNLSERRQADDDSAVIAGPVRQFWIIKHGIKMTAMPAWGTSHDDKSIWAIVAFLRKLPELSPAQYQAMTAAGSGPSHEHGGHHHSEQHGEPEAPDAGADDHVHEHDESMDTHDAEMDGHHHDAAEEHAHDDEEMESPHSH